MEEALQRLTLEDASHSESSDEINETLEDEQNVDQENQDEHNVSKWWEEEDDGILWKKLVHKGPVFPPPYKPLRFLYDNNVYHLSPNAEEMAVFYARFLDHDYTTEETKQKFNTNFFIDWRKIMTEKERDDIRDFSKCDFTEMYDFFSNMSLENKKRLKIAQQQEYGYCMRNGRKERVSNYRIPAPDLCRTKTHSKLGVMIKRVLPEDVTINCSKGHDPPAPAGHKWKKVIHDNKAQWLASWTNNLRQTSYMNFHLNSDKNAKSDYQKFETARALHKYIDNIRAKYRDGWKLKNSVLERQKAVALYFIDKLAIRVGSTESKDAETFGCCTLLREHVTLHHDENDDEYKVKISFKGKNSIDYCNEIVVDKLVYQNLEQFKSNKDEKGKLFDQLTRSKLDAYLKKQMPGLTAKVFRTYHASKILEKTLKKNTVDTATIEEKIKTYHEATLASANLCNHKKSITSPNPKAKPQQKVQEKVLVAGDLTTKGFYTDPRITAAWCIKHGVPIEKVFIPSELEKFVWAIEMVKADNNYKFLTKT